MDNAAAHKIHTDIVAPLRLGDNIPAQPLSGQREVSSPTVHSGGRGGFERSTSTTSANKA